MQVGVARAVAAEWVRQHAARQSGFRGAFFSGSTVGLPDHAELAAASDVDVVVVTAQSDAPAKIGKFAHRGALLEVSYLAERELSSAATVLSTYYLAASFRTDTIIADPTGLLRALHVEVAQRFAERVWVRRRCADVRQRIGNGLRAIDSSAPWHAQVMSWLFSASLATQVLLVAALRRPTVRLRYVAAHRVLLDYGQADRHEDLLALLGCVDLTGELVEGHLNELARTFDATAAVAKTPFLFSSDITAAARPIAIDGSRALIESGRHREAVFWLVATFARCHTILAVDAPELGQAHAPAFGAMLAELGIVTSDDLLRRAQAVTDFLPVLDEIGESIIAANPEISVR